MTSRKKKSNELLTLEEFEQQLRRLVPSLARYMMRPAGNDLVVAVGELPDSYAVVRAASSANIALETGWLFQPMQPPTRGIEHCFLRFQLSNKCIDERLFWFIKELELDATRNFALR